MREHNFTIPEMRLAVPFVAELYIKMSRFTNVKRNPEIFLVVSSIENDVGLNSCRQKNHFIPFLGEKMKITKNQAISRLVVESSTKVLQKLELWQDQGVVVLS